jgi:hypothetical protein
MTQNRLSKFISSVILFAAIAYWLWLLFANADKIFRQ